MHSSMIVGGSERTLNVVDYGLVRSPPHHDAPWSSLHRSRARRARGDRPAADRRARAADACRRRRRARAVGGALPQIAAVVDAVAERLAAGGRLIYVGAGTAGRLGVLDAERVRPDLRHRSDPRRARGRAGRGERGDRERRGRHRGRDPRARGLDVGANDAVLGISASGRTPYVLAAIGHAREHGALTAASSAIPGSELSAAAEHAIEVIVGPEFIAGSTRLKSGTAQKLVLNMLSTLLMVRLGKTYGNLMVDLRVTNGKLRDRARRIVAQAAGVDAEEAARGAGRGGRRGEVRGRDAAPGRGGRAGARAAGRGRRAPAPRARRVTGHPADSAGAPAHASLGSIRSRSATQRRTSRIETTILLAALLAALAAPATASAAALEPISTNGLGLTKTGLGSADYARVAKLETQYPPAASAPSSPAPTRRPAARQRSGAQRREGRGRRLPLEQGRQRSRLLVSAGHHRQRRRGRRRRRRRPPGAAGELVLEQRQGPRGSFVNADKLDSAKYRHVLLVSPTTAAASARQEPRRRDRLVRQLPLRRRDPRRAARLRHAPHAQGAEAPTKRLGYAFILPQVGLYKTTKAELVFSSSRRSHRPAGHALVTGEYRKGATGGRVVRWPLDAGDGLPVGGHRRGHQSPATNVQGALMVSGRIGTLLERPGRQPRRAHSGAPGQDTAGIRGRTPPRT